MATQADLFKKFQKVERPEFIKFTEMNVPIQGIVREVYVGTEYDPQTKSARLNRRGEEMAQVTLTLELEDGTLRRQGFAGNLLFKLRDALQEQGLEEVPIGALVGSAWTGMWQNPSGGRSAREHTVKVKVG